MADILVRENETKEETVRTETAALLNSYNPLIAADRKKLIKALEKEMEQYAEELRFEEAALVRDKIEELGGFPATGRKGGAKPAARPSAGKKKA